MALFPCLAGLALLLAPPAGALPQQSSTGTHVQGSFEPQPLAVLRLEDPSVFAENTSLHAFEHWSEGQPVPGPLGIYGVCLRLDANTAPTVLTDESLRS